MSTTKTTPIIRLKDLRKSFGNKEVLTGIDLDIYRGESVVVIGGSGSGKSVLIKSILGILLLSAVLMACAQTKLAVHIAKEAKRITKQSVYSDCC